MNHHPPSPSLTRVFGAALLAAALLAGPALRAQEGWNPFKQATSQIPRPNLLIVLDVSGSMAWSPDKDSIKPGVDSFGLPSLTWSSSHNWDSDVYTWTLTAANQPPCRLDVFKNALGNSVPLYGTKSSTSPYWTSPTISWPTQSAGWPTPHSGYTYTGGGVWTSSSNQPPFYTSVGGGWNPVYYVTWNAPDYSTSPVTKPTLDGWNPGLTPTTLPQNLVGLSKNQVNWGLEIFSTSLPDDFDKGYGGSGNAYVLQPVSADDKQSTQDANAAAIESYLKPYIYKGLSAYNNTATSAALNLAKSSLNGTHSANGGDPAAACGRFYGVVLVTDGASNTCNPDNGAYQDCGSGVPSNWYQFPEGRTDELFVETADPGSPNGSACSSGSFQSPVPVRTFVIGVSGSVSRCELNLDAFMGRTDASSPNGDAGMDIAKDQDASTNYRLPLNVPSNFIPAGSPLTTGTATATTNYQSIGSCTTNCKDYAFFATNATALHDAFQTILGAAGAGDYSTGAPVVSNSLVNAGNISYVSSVTYPAMQGHLYSYDMQVLSKPTLLWDAGQILAGRDLNPASSTYAPRTILTWDPANPTAKPINLCSMNWDSNSPPAAIKTLLGDDPNAFYFLQGYANAVSGGGNKYVPGPQRSWLLGSILNSTAAIIGAPQTWTGQSTLPDHVSFEQTYNTNHPMITVGASDGMLHFFDVADGYEVLAILPPDQLANQEALYLKYAAGNATATGEPKDPSKHIYGVASSPRFADVYLTSDKTYHTVLLMTEGKGGRSLAGLDITHPYPGRTNVVVPYVTVLSGSPVLHSKTVATYNKDPNYDASYPVSGLWYKDGALPASSASYYSKLGQTWSVPGLGFTGGTATSPIFSCVLGGGFSDPSGSYKNPYGIQLNVADGSETGSKDLGNGSGLVHNQAYGAGVLFNSTAPYNRPNDKLSLGVVADTNGGVWGVNAATGSMSSLFLRGTSFPIYFTPAVGYYAGYDIYAYASGNFYETSTSVTGPSFQPTVSITLVDPTGTKNTVTVSNDISSFTYPDPSDPSKTKYVPSTAQITSDPMLFIPSNSVPSSATPVKAYFTFYDPNPALGCGGASFLIKVSLDLSLITGGTPATTTAAASLGAGAASGIAFSGGKIIVAKSAIGKGNAAPQATNENAPTTINQAPGINAWQELK